MGEGLAWEPGAATWGCRKQGTDKPRPASPQAKGDRETYPAQRPGDHGGRTEKTIPAPGDLTSDGLPALSPSPLGPRSTVRQLPWPLAPLSLSPPVTVTLPQFLSSSSSLPSTSIPATVKEKTAKTCKTFVFGTKMRCHVSLVFAQFQAWCVWYLKLLLSSVSLYGRSVFRDAGREGSL